MPAEKSSEPVHHAPLVIGVTGNIACGKSTVLRMLSELGAKTVDADVVYRELIASGSPLWHALIERFGTQILDQNGDIDRRKLGRIVFSDPNALADLDQITHPAVVDAVRSIVSSSREAVVAVDAVKLVESGMDELCDAVWLVTCAEDDQLNRLLDRDELTRDDAIRRIQAQPPLDQKLQAADVIIDNSHALAATHEQVTTAWKKLIEARRVPRTP